MDTSRKQVDIPLLEPETSSTWAGTGYITTSSVRMSHTDSLGYVIVQCVATNTALETKVSVTMNRGLLLSVASGLLIVCNCCFDARCTHIFY